MRARAKDCEGACDSKDARSEANADIPAALSLPSTAEVNHRD